jgi:hypothetical protein
MFELEVEIQKKPFVLGVPDQRLKFHWPVDGIRPIGVHRPEIFQTHNDQIQVTPLIDDNGEKRNAPKITTGLFNNREFVEFDGVALILRVPAERLYGDSHRGLTFLRRDEVNSNVVDPGALVSSLGQKIQRQKLTESSSDD